MSSQIEHSSSTVTDAALRIACYGFAEQGAGSVASAGFVILEHLLKRGHRIDFFNKSTYVRPRDLEGYPNFRFIDVPNPKTDRMAELAEYVPGPVVKHVAWQIRHRTFINGIIRQMRSRHIDHRYDLQLWLGDWAAGRVPGVPVVSWVQGPPETDSRSVVRDRKDVIELGGWKTYILLRIYAVYRASFGLPNFKNCDRFIVGSEWSRERLQTYNLDRDRISKLAYPVDIRSFSPLDTHRPSGLAPLVLWVGRIVPRKRLDLFLEACSKLLDDGREIRVTVIGQFGFVPGYCKLLSKFKHVDRLTYIEKMPRDEVIPLLRSAAVLVQPSEEENFGSAVAEAIACGTPVVIGPTNGTGDYIGEGGIRFARYESADVAEAIGKALDTQTTLRQHARKAAEQFLQPEVIVDQLEEILRGAVRLYHQPKETDLSIAALPTISSSLPPN